MSDKNNKSDNVEFGEGQWTPLFGKLNKEKKEASEYEMARLGAEITLARVDDFEDLNAETKEKGHEKFKQKTKELWKEFVVHGMLGKDKEGKRVLTNFSDLDGDASIGFLKLAGIDTSNIKYVHQGEFVEGKINIDTGNRWGLVVKDGGKTVFIDHHGPDAKKGASSAEITYKLLTGLGLLDEKKYPYLGKMAEFVTKMDNADYDLNKGFFEEKFSRTLFGLRNNLSFEHLQSFFKNKNNNQWDVLDDRLLGKMGKDKTGEKTILEHSKELQKKVEYSIRSLKFLEKNGKIIDSKRYGKIVIDEGGKIPCGFDAVKAFGCGAYVKWVPKNNFFFITAVNEITDDFGQGINVRGNMWIKENQDESPLKITLDDVVKKMTGDIPSGKLQGNMRESSMKEMEQPEAKTKESEQKASKIEQEDVKVEFITEGEKMRMDEEKERTERSIVSSKLSAETEKASADVLKENSDKILRDLTEEYYNENEDSVRQKTKVYDKNISREAKYDIVRNLGAFDEIKNKKGTWAEESFEKFALAEGYDELRAQIKSGKTGIETPALILNSLEISKKEIQKKLDERDMNSDNLEYVLNGVARTEAIKKYTKIFSAQIELAEKIYGGTLMGEDDKKNLIKFGYLGEGLVHGKALAKEKEAEVLKEIKEKIFGTKWDILSKEEKDKYGNDFNQFVKSNIEKQTGDIGKKYDIDEKTALALMEHGYYPENFSIKMKSFRMGSNVYLAGGGDGVSEKEFKQFIKNYKDSFEKDIVKKAGEKAELEEMGARNLFLGLKEKVSKLAIKPEAAQKEMTKAFAELKEKMINDGIEKSLKKEEKTREQLERITRKFEGGKPEAENFLKALVNRKGKGISELTDGDFDENFGNIRDFMGDFGISTDSFETMDAGKKGKLKERYKKNAKNKTGFVKFMLDFVEALLSPNK